MHRKPKSCVKFDKSRWYNLQVRDIEALPTIMDESNTGLDLKNREEVE